MAATFRTRPWALASARPSFSPSVCAGRGLMANMEPTRQYATRSRIDPRLRQSLTQIKRDQGKQEATSTLIPQMLDENNLVSGSEMAVLAPGTLVPLPLSRAPSGWKNFFKYYKEWLKQRFTDRVQIFQQTFQLKEKFWHRATFGAPRKGVVEAALSLHAAMSQDMARGGPAERAHLSQLCVPKMARSLNSAITARPKGKRYEWERLELTGRPFWPRLVDHKWSEVDVGFRMSFRQAVVGIKSKQRLTELDNKGKVVGTKEMELLEYVVLWCRVDKAKRKMGDWQLYGTLKETSLEQLLRNQSLIKRMADIGSAKELQDRKKQLDQS